MARAASVEQVLKTKFQLLPFEGDWLESLGCPELTGTWIIWGSSGNGKTRFALQLHQPCRREEPGGTRSQKSSFR